MTHMQPTPQVQEVIDAWKLYVDGIDDWQALTKGVEPKATGCGPVYELDDPLDRGTESFAIADMRGVDVAQPHYHANGEVEIYFVLQGLGQVVVGDEIIAVGKGSVVATPSNVTHYAIPGKDEGLVLAVVNTPPFNPENVVDVYKTDQDTHYNHEQFEQLTKAS